MGLEIIDATCPVVTKLQERVRKFYDQGYQVVIFGKKDHAEVLGVRGVCNDQCKVVISVDQALNEVDLDQKTVFFSQTTMDRPTFLLIKDALQAKIKDLVIDTMENIATEFHAKDTICGQVSGREFLLKQFAEQNPNAYILYLHTKGNSYESELQNITDWINMMLYFLVEKYESCKRIFTFIIIQHQYILIKVVNLLCTFIREKLYDIFNTCVGSGNCFFIYNYCNCS